MTDWSKIAVDAARDDWSPEARAAAAEARKRNAGLAKYHGAEAEKHFNAMQSQVSSVTRQLLQGHR